MVSPLLKIRSSFQGISEQRVVNPCLERNVAFQSRQNVVDFSFANVFINLLEIKFTPLDAVVF